MNQQVICEHLALVGLKTVIAENGKAAVEMVQSRMENSQDASALPGLPGSPRSKKQFDLILMDIHMPIMDGFEASSKILALNASIPIVAMTANIMADEMKVYKTNGMNECVGKPFTSQELWRCLLKYFTPVKWQTVQGSRSAQDENKMRQNLISDFIKDNQNRFSEIADAIATNDITLAHRMAHNIKSNAGHLGRVRLQSVAAALEQQLADVPPTVTQEQMHLLQAELDAALSQLTAELETNLFSQPGHEPPPDTNIEPLDADASRKLLVELEPLLKTGNPECLKFIGNIRRLPTKASGEMLQHIENFDFEQAFTVFTKLKAELTGDSSAP
jgi:CheY-like chemotaxis protein